MTIDSPKLMEERIKKKDKIGPEEYREMCMKIQKECRRAKELYNSKCKEIKILNYNHSDRKYQKIKE